MDEQYVRAVMRFFVHLYRRGWIYRANRIINWCPYHLTSLSDLELEHEDVDDTLSTIRYPLADGDGHIPIATVRPATIPADVAVAVHPEDERYKHLVGREVIVPWTENRVPVIADERVEREFGTGALKITPGHDPTDFEIGRDHGLPEPSCIGPDGLVTAEGLEGLTQKEAEREDPRLVPRARACSRSASTTGTASRSASAATRASSRSSRCSGGARWTRSSSARSRRSAAREVRYHPESQHRFAIDSLENAPDWCISRQLWWGHQIPVWYCPDGHVTVEETEPDRVRRVRVDGARRARRTCSTRGSARRSGRSPRSAGPTRPTTSRSSIPGNLQTTARDIIRLWENRMIFSGLELLGERAVRRRRSSTRRCSRPTDGACRSRSATGIDPFELLGTATEPTRRVTGC